MKHDSVSPSGTIICALQLHCNLINLNLTKIKDQIKDAFLIVATYSCVLWCMNLTV